jgi:hypothetical protein
MKLTSLLVGATTVLALGTVAGVADAGVQTFSYDITASGFSYEFGPTGDTPIDPVTLKFSVTLDPTATTGPTTAGLNITSFNLPYATGGFAYAPGDALTVATDPGFDNFGDASDSWGAFIYDPFSKSPSAFIEQTDGTGESWVVSSVPVVTSVVPESATWVMMLMGLFGLGAVLRRAGRKQFSLAVAA